MDTPGNDPVSMTGLVSGGCNLGVFTTGRGSVFGCKPSPCIKVATNTPLYQWMEDDMDLNAGTILDGTETVEQVGCVCLIKWFQWPAVKKPRASNVEWEMRNLHPGCLVPRFNEGKECSNFTNRH
jgi:hypothetical protein